MREKPLTLHAIPETIDILKAIFSTGSVARFTQIPDAQRPVIRYEPIAMCNPVALNGRRITPLPPTTSCPRWFSARFRRASLVFTGYHHHLALWLW